MVPTAISPATDTIGDSVFYVEADGGSYISDYLNTYSYGARRLNSPDLHPDEMVSFAVMRNGMTWGEGQQGSYIEIPYGRSPSLPGWGSPSLYSGGAYGVNLDGNVVSNVDVDYDSCGLSVRE